MAFVFSAGIRRLAGMGYVEYVHRMEEAFHAVRRIQRHHRAAHPFLGSITFFSCPPGSTNKKQIISAKLASGGVPRGRGLTDRPRVGTRRRPHECRTTQKWTGC